MAEDGFKAAELFRKHHIRFLHIFYVGISPAQTYTGAQ